MENAELLSAILQSADKHPNARVSKLIRNVEAERTQKNIVLLLIELAEHAEYASDFAISLKYYLDMFEWLGNGHDILLNETGLLLLNSSKVYSRRVDYVHELVERQILTLSNADREITEAINDQQSTAPEKFKRSRKRLLEAPKDPYEVELTPKKFRKISNDKRFSVNNSSSSSVSAKTKIAKSRQIETEQYIHPAGWVHSSIVDLENEEEIDSKRNYKLFTYHVEHRYNTLVPDINFRLHFMVKDFIDKEQEDNMDVCDSSETDWPPLSEAYVQQYLNLENRVLACGEIVRSSNNENQTIGGGTIPSNAEPVDMDVSIENDSGHFEDCDIDQTLELTIDNKNDSTELKDGQNENEVKDQSGDSIEENSTESNSQSADTIDKDGEVPNDKLNDSSLPQANDSGLGSSILDSSTSTNNTTANTDATLSGSDLTNTSINQSLQNDSALGESITDQDVTIESTAVNETSSDLDVTKIDSGHESSDGDDADTTNDITLTKETNEKDMDEIRIVLPNLDDEGVFFSDLDTHEKQLFSPSVLAVDVFPCLPDKKNFTIRVDDDIRAMLNISDDEPETHEIPVQTRETTCPLILNIMKIPEKIVKRRVLFKLGPEYDLYIHSRMRKRTRAEEQRSAKQIKLMKPLNQSHNHSDSIDYSGFLSDNESMSEFLGFPENEETSIDIDEKMHRLSRDSGVGVDDRVALGKSLLDTIDEEKSSDSNASNNPSQNLTGENNTPEIVDLQPKDTEPSSPTPESDSVNTTNVEEKTETPTTDEVASDSNIPPPDSLGDSINNAEISTCTEDEDVVESEKSESSEHQQQEGDSEDSESYHLNNELTDIELNSSKTKIQKWHEHLQPILAKSRERHHFDVFQIGTEIMDDLNEDNGHTSDKVERKCISFQDVMDKKDPTYVSRYFLSSLLLANQSNIKIAVNNKNSEEPSAWDDIKFELLSTKRHTVSIEDNIGMVHSSKSVLKTQPSKESSKTKPIEVLKPAGSTSKSHITTECQFINVNLDAVKPLTQIQKVPNNSDDYDSGIFSSEELA